MRSLLRSLIASRAALAWVALASLSLPSETAAGPPEGRKEVHASEPTYEGTTANAPVPAKYHLQNEGGSDGAGLCVISSIIANGQYQGVPGLAIPDAEGHAGKGSALWREAKAAPGGYSPDKLARLVDKVMPGEKYASFTDTDTGVLDRLSAMGLPIGATMNTGELYNWSPIHHMISLVHFDSKRDLACHVDNNKPGVFTWTSAREFAKRWIDGGEGWAWVWTRQNVSPLGPGQPGGSLFVCSSIAGAIIVISSARVRSQEVQS